MGLSGNECGRLGVMGENGCLRTASGDQVQRDVDEHVFLPADHAPSACFHQQAAGIDVVAVSYTHLTLPTIYSV